MWQFELFVTEVSEEGKGKGGAYGNERFGAVLLGELSPHPKHYMNAQQLYLCS